MARSKNKANYELLKWKCLVCGQESPRRFERSMEASTGWTSESRTQFPIDIILAFPKPVNIWKFVINCSENKQRRFFHTLFLNNLEVSKVLQHPKSKFELEPPLRIP